MTTSNNLREHLSWLLSAKPFLPPLSPAVPQATETPDSSNTQGISSSSSRLENNLEDARSISISNSRISQDEALEASGEQSEAGPSSAQPQQTEQVDVGDMARLRSVPNSATRPKLFVHDGKFGTKSPDRQHVEAPGRSSAGTLTYCLDEPTPIRLASLPRTARSTGQNAGRNMEDWDIDAIDLTGDIDVDHRSSPTNQPSAPRGHKRKSDEYESDLPPRHPIGGSRNTFTSQRQSTSVVDDFIPIDEVPTDPPPPYSTLRVPPPVRRPAEAHFGRDVDIPDDMFLDPDYGERIDIPEQTTTLQHKNGKAQPNPSSSTFTRPGRASLQDSRVRSPIKPTETPCTKRRRARIVVDSEDEEMFDDSFETLDVEEAPDSRENYDQRRRVTPLEAVNNPIKSPNCSLPLSCPGSSRLVTNSRPPGMNGIKNNPSSSMNNDRPQPVIRSTSDEQGFQQTQSMLPSEDEKVILQAFLEWPEEILPMYEEDLQQQLAAQSKSIVEQLDDAGEAPTHMLADGKLLKQKIAAVAELRTTHQSYLTLSRRKDELKVKVFKAFNDIFGTSEDNHDMEEFKAVWNEVRIVASDLIRLLHATGLIDGRNRLRKLRDRQKHSNDIVVRSTQVTPNSERPLGRVPNSGIVAHTQFVEQTQSRIDSMAAPSGTRSVSKKDMNHSNNHGTDRIIVQQDYHESKAAYDQDQDSHRHLFTTNMGSPPYYEQGEDEDFGFVDNDEDMLRMAEDFEDAPKVKSYAWDRNSRIVFAETSGNQKTPIRPTNQNAVPKDTPKPPSSTPPTLMQHRWSRDVKAALKDRFKLRGFRQNQLEAINATLGGKDVFVLMPTGGGKSLCYQLPSIVRSGKTRGVTVVISPLLSLMEDQVQHLKRLHIQAFLINSECTAEERRHVFQALRDPRVEDLIQLLYITPEMITKSDAIINVFRSLHERSRLARIVIDEAHCVSQWGHDFRPDYKQLGDVRRQFTGVPVIALTATATENVKFDVIHNLGITGCEQYKQSFNRPNLMYEVRPKGKGKDLIESIASTINEKYRGQSGIIYCLSRKKCESVAEDLNRNYGIKAHHYHAAMESSEKKEVQRKWQANIYQVIVATIAFGMGIDKPDVRFVMHHSIPKSLEGYYQETGRAGRDGKRSGCYLYYGYQDTTVLKRMIDDGEGSWEQKQRQHQMLRNVVHFCDNRSDCRRVQILAYFNEQFQRENCNGFCDNCNSTSTFESTDFTDYAKSAIELVRQIQAENITLLHCVDVFRGAKNKKITELGHNQLEQHGLGASLDRGDVERLFYRLLSEDALKEYNKVNRGGFAASYISVGRNSAAFSSGRVRLKIQIRVSPNGKSKKARQVNKTQQRYETGVPGSRREYAVSTNVSSPVQAAARRRKHPVAHEEDEGELHPDGYYRNSFVVDDAEEDSDCENYFEPNSPPRRIATKRTAAKEVGPPITADAKMESLTPNRRMIVDDFVHHARQECREIMLDKNLRAHPFTDTILREMAINFPGNESELMQIPGINKEMVKHYGKKFLKLIKRSQEFYESIMERENEDRPHDPNHEVVNLVSDDEEENLENLFSDGDESTQEERSTYFPPAHVLAFNQQHVATQKPAIAHLQQETSKNATSRPVPNKGGRKTSGGRARGGNNAGKKGVSGKKWTAGASNCSRGNHRGVKRGGGGSAFGGGIAAMPI